MSGNVTTSDLTLRVGTFEGPFDLLLHLCRTNEIDLAALPVRAITDQYLAHLEAMEFRDLEAAGAYLVMAATLIYLKSKLLVPPDETQDEQLDEDGLSLRLELEARLREYARVKALGEWLAAREAEQSLIWGRPGSTLPPPEEVPLEDLSVHLLDRTLRRLIEDQGRQRPREVEPNPPSVLERMTMILSVLRDTWSLLFSSLTAGDRRRSEIVVSLLAVLELVRLGRIKTQQTELFGEIVVEALLFASDTPLEAERIREVLDLPDVHEARRLIDELRARYEASSQGLQIVEVGGGYRMVTRPEVAPWLVRLARARTRARLSRPALEALAIIAYKQPVSRPEIDAVRGVNSDAVLDNLLERRLVRIAGRKEAPGRPYLFETTREFLVAFGLRDVGDLPKVEGELIIPELAGVAEHGEAATQQDPGPGGADLSTGR